MSERFPNNADAWCYYMGEASNCPKGTVIEFDRDGGFFGNYDVLCYPNETPVSK